MCTVAAQSGAGASGVVKTTTIASGSSNSGISSGSSPLRLTVAKTGEAQVFRDAGASRLLVHYPPIGEAKWERLAQLAAQTNFVLSFPMLLMMAVASHYPVFRS